MTSGGACCTITAWLSYTVELVVRAERERCAFRSLAAAIRWPEDWNCCIKGLRRYEPGVRISGAPATSASTGSGGSCSARTRAAEADRRRSQVRYGLSRTVLDG